MQETYIGISGINDVVMAPALGLSGGMSTGSVSFVITTDNRAGYRATIAASHSPAMRSLTDDINDYVTQGVEPDLSFVYGASDAFFGFSPEGVDIVSRYKDNGSVCGVGSMDSSNVCWDAVGTTSKEIVRSSAGNHPDGSTTTLKFRVGIGSSASVEAGVYTATTTVTAITL